MKEGKHEVGSRAGITQVGFEGWGVTYQMPYSYGFTLLFHTIFHRVIFRGVPLAVCPMRSVMMGRKKIACGQGRSVGGRKFISLFYECILTVTSMGYCTLCGTLGCLCVQDG